MKILGVTASLVHLLREEIITGQLGAGEKLNETALAERMGISRPPLREAFRKLEYENLVVSIPRKGTFVTKLSAEDCQELYFARKVLEMAAIDSIAAKDISRFPKLRRALKAGISHKVPDRFNFADMLHYYNVMADFHFQLVASCNNNWLMHCYNSLRSNLARYQIMYLSLPDSQQLSVNTHRKVLEMLEAGEYARAKNHLQSHIERVTRRLIEKLYNNNKIHSQSQS